MNTFEMEGFLRGKCLPGDMKVKETNAEYLVRKFSELEQRLIESERYGRQTDITIDNLEMKLAQMAAENAGLKNALEWLYETVSSESVSIPDEKYSSVTNAAQALSETPKTDSFLAEVRAQGVEMFSEKFGGGTLLSNMVKETAKGFAAQLRKGVQS